VADANWGVTVQYTGYSISLPSMQQIAWVSEQQIEAVLP
jgi:hypothetical protein